LGTSFGLKVSSALALKTRLLGVAEVYNGVAPVGYRNTTVSSWICWIRGKSLMASKVNFTAREQERRREPIHCVAYSPERA